MPRISRSRDGKWRVVGWGVEATGGTGVNDVIDVPAGTDVDERCVECGESIFDPICGYVHITRRDKILGVDAVAIERKSRRGAAWKELAARGRVDDRDERGRARGRMSLATRLVRAFTVRTGLRLSYEDVEELKKVLQGTSERWDEWVEREGERGRKREAADRKRRRRKGDYE